MSDLEAIRDSAERRRAGIRQLVEQQGFCTVQELSAAFGVSDMTVRRDVQRLSHEGVVRSVHGGVTMLTPASMTGTTFGLRSARRKAAKLAIARRAAELLPSRGAVALDAGTTTLELALLLPDRSSFRVVTSSLAVVNALMTFDELEVFGLPGVLHRGTQSFSSTTTLAAIADLHVKAFFLAASGLTAHGVFCGNDYDAVTKRAMLGAADEVVLLADSEKFDISAMVRVCSFDDVDRIVTDDELTDEQRGWLEDHDVIVDTVEVGGMSDAIG